MSPAEQHERITAMLSRYRDALASSSILTTGSHDSRILLLPPEFNQAMRELDRCLDLMRKLGTQQAINGIPLRTIRWHTIAWHIDADSRQVPVYTRTLQRHHGKGPKTIWAKKLDGYRLETTRNRDARQDKAELGVGWLAQHYHWNKIHLRAIREACGEHAQAA